MNVTCSCDERYAAMGGPCFLQLESKQAAAAETTNASTTKYTKKVLGPPCTDNFQIREFDCLGHTYYSCEQAYQALKFAPGRHQAALTPWPPLEKPL
jgi:coenzyme F420-reducing hydrogenase beta subunit